MTAGASVIGTITAAEAAVRIAGTWTHPDGRQFPVRKIDGGGFEQLVKLDELRADPKNNVKVVALSYALVRRLLVGATAVDVFGHDDAADGLLPEDLQAILDVASGGAKAVGEQAPKA